MTYTEKTYYFDFESPEISDYLSRFDLSGKSQKEIAQTLYLAVRDGWHYNPFLISTAKKDYKASNLVNRPTGHCIDKSTLLITFLRAFGIPARIHLAKVRNHIGVEKLMEKLGTNELSPHGFVEVLIEDKWVKATPAFNKRLCEKLNVAVLDFDGENHSVFQEYDQAGGQFMEYVEDYGDFADVPLDFIADNFKKHYSSVVTDFDPNGFNLIK